MYAKFIDKDRRFAFSETDNGGVEITPEMYEQLFDAQGSGAEIHPDKNGYPMAVFPPPPTDEDLAIIALARRDQFLSDAMLAIAPLQDAVDLDDATMDEAALLKKWKQYRVAVNRVTNQLGYPRDIEWPEQPQ
ncbi:tail fiber assembly protein [Collimonas sp. NPDC087041]|uniref:tail fiber assembly protein n=1 Tax=Collimonas sp. NPDC087041 TaxID=3363960 RepID=UPI00382C4AAA